mmetsp:Transcript_66486/g.203464  ORF Transcript_66486/g.203464 Transcript_66486/m.203464 type:complete len:232 (+) Transcript_66486:1146-1841(+)
MISPNGPSLLCTLLRSSISKEHMIIGTPNTSVFPLPVKAMPIMSRPFRTAGIPCIWICVGRWIPLAFKPSRMPRGSRMSSKRFTGAGMSSPLTSMKNFSRIVVRSSSGMSRYRLTGRHPPIEGMRWVYSMPLARSRTDTSGVLSCSCTCSRMRPSSSWMAFFSACSRESLLASSSARIFCETASSEFATPRFFFSLASRSSRMRFASSCCSFWREDRSFCARCALRAFTGT